MRGKSVDTEFVAKFVQECMNLNKNTTSEICEEAITRMAAIDEQLKLRTKLIDVLSHFNYKKKPIEQKIEHLDFNKIDRKIATEIFSLIENIPNIDTISSFVVEKFNDNYRKEIFFTLKQLLEYKILILNTFEIIKGNNYDAYIDFNGKIQ